MELDIEHLVPLLTFQCCDSVAVWLWLVNHLVVVAVIVWLVTNFNLNGC